MHWQMGNNSQDWSYLFIVAEGIADLNSNGIFEAGEIFVFHIGHILRSDYLYHVRKYHLNQEKVLLYLIDYKSL